MELAAFASRHLPALKGDEIAFTVQIAVIEAAVKNPTEGLAFWSLGEPGQMAIKTPGRNILLGPIGESGSQQLATLTKDIPYPGVMGPRTAARQFVTAATAQGAAFSQAVEMRVHSLTVAPRYPGANGVPRLVEASDTALLFAWLSAFQAEAVPHEPAPTLAGAERAAASGRYWFWTVDGEPVSVACIHRPLRTSAAIGAVYTPPGLRGHGYAGSVVARGCEDIFASGKRAACLYTNLANPASNRCYEKIGFRGHCDTAMFHRTA